MDQAGDGLEWDGSAADCTGRLVYRDGKKRNPTIMYLDDTDFAVADARSPMRGRAGVLSRP